MKAYANPPVVAFQASGSAILALAYSPNGRYLASAGHSKEGEVRAWEAARGAPVSTYRGHEGTVYSLSWSPDGRHLASGGDDQTVRTWETGGSRQQSSLYRGHNTAVFKVLWSPDGRYLASRSGEVGRHTGDWSLHVRDARSGARLAQIDDRASWARALAWSPGSTRIASLPAHPSTIEMRLPETGEIDYSLRAPGEVTEIAWSPDGERLALALYSGFFSGGNFAMCDARTREPLLPTQRYGDGVESPAWSPDGTRVAFVRTTDNPRTSVVTVIEAASGKEVAIYDPGSGPLYTVVWSPGGSHIAAAGNDGVVRIWPAGRAVG